MTNITHDTYEILLNQIGHWLISNNKKFNKRNTYEYQGRIADLGTVESAIVNRKNTLSSDGLTGRYVESAIVDNSDYSFLPNYVTHNGTKYMKANIVNMIQRELAFEQKNGRVPATIDTDIKTTITANNNKLNSYMTAKGCSGMGQCTGYYCACNSLQQCFYRLTGINVDESVIAGVAGTTSKGTSHQGIETAVAWFNKKYNHNIKIAWKNFSDLGNNDSARWNKMQELIDNGALFCHILYRNKYGHYEVPQKINKDNLTILNSLGSKCSSTAYCGYIETRAKATQLSYMKGISQKSICILTRG